MKKRKMTRYQAQLGLVAASVLVGAGLLVANGAAIAAQSDESVPEIVVTAPRTVKQTIGRSSSTGAPIEVTRISREVTYGDLDLSSNAGATALKQRVTDTAKALCEELDKLYPLEPKDTQCVAKATANSMKLADAAIAAASK